VGELRVLHLWSDYSPALFDHSHPYCLEQGIPSRVAVGNYIETGATVPEGVVRLRTRSPVAQESSGFGWRLLRGSQNLLFGTRLELLAFRQMMVHRPSVLHFHFATTAARMLHVVQIAPTPIIVSLYGVDASAALRDGRIRRQYQIVYRHATRLLVLCEAVAERLRVDGCPAHKIHILNLPAGVEMYPYRERAYDGITRFVIAARFVEKKGYPVLLRALGRVIQRRRDVHLTMLGYGPSEWIRMLVERLGLAEFCTIIVDGQRDFAARFRGVLNQSDVFVLPSTTSRTGDDEGGPALSLVAAQAAGLPVIATPFPGAELSVFPGRSGLLAAPDDDASLAECMLSVCARPEIWRALGREGSRVAHAEFSREGQCQRLLQVYRDVMSARSAERPERSGFNG
jgi:colanic acid/amylovoran biosynthesis glycosyltransferase